MDRAALVLLAVLAGFSAAACAESPSDKQICNHFASDYPEVECPETSRCCMVGFEHEWCLPRDEPCPILCPGENGTCPTGQYCVLEPDHEESSCTVSCPRERQNHRYSMATCCAEGAHSSDAGNGCEDDGTDASVADAAIRDGGERDGH